MNKRNKKYKKSITQNRKQNNIKSSDSSDIPLSIRIYNMLQHHLKWTIAGVKILRQEHPWKIVMGLATLIGVTIGIVTWHDSNKAKKAVPSINIGGIEIDRDKISQMNIIFLMPMAKLSGQPLTAILPIQLINHNYYDINSCEVQMITLPFMKEKPIVELTEGYSSKKTSTKHTIKEARFIRNIYPEIEKLGDFQRKSILLPDAGNEIINYYIPHFKALTTIPIFEEFKIDTTKLLHSGESFRCKDYFPIKFTLLRENNIKNDTFDFNIFIFDYISLDDLIKNYAETGLLGDFLGFGAEKIKRIPNILIYPFFYQEDGIWKTSIEKAQIYYLCYDTPYATNFFSPHRKLIIWNPDELTHKEYIISDTEERKQEIFNKYEFIRIFQENRAKK